MVVTATASTTTKISCAGGIGMANNVPERSKRPGLLPLPHAEHTVIGCAFKDR